MKHSLPLRSASRITAAVLCAAALIVIGGCSKERPQAPAKAPVDVTVVTIVPRDVPVTATYVAQTQSSQAVNIQARVSGFLDKRLYTEGSTVRAGTVLFQMDRKPFQAQVDGAAAALQRNQAAFEVARSNLARTKPLTELEALSQKDLDDAQGQYEQAAAAVEQAKAQLEQARLNLSYTTIASPVAGVTSYAMVPDGTYVDQTNSQLTTVSVLSPIWINFSVSENEIQRIRDRVAKGLLRLPERASFVVQIELADGTLFPHTGRITFTEPSYNPQTGTFLLRASVDNPDGVLRPNQYVRTRLQGAVHPNAILVPQRAVQQGAKGHFVWVVDKAGKAALRPVVVGDWYGESWFIAQGLNAGDQVVVDGALRLAPDAPVSAKPFVPKPGSPELAPATVPDGASLVVHFAPGKASLDAEAMRLLKGFAPAMRTGTNVIEISGYADRTGNRAANVDLATRRAHAVRVALLAEGLPAERLRLKPPGEVIGSGSERDARRVEIAVAR
jgi:membrane fusion protein (multidrug efflux system)